MGLKKTHFLSVSPLETALYISADTVKMGIGLAVFFLGFGGRNKTRPTS